MAVRGTAKALTVTVLVTVAVTAAVTVTVTVPVTVSGCHYGRGRHSQGSGACGRLTVTAAVTVTVAMIVAVVMTLIAPVTVTVPVTVSGCHYGRGRHSQGSGAFGRWLIRSEAANGGKCSFWLTGGK